MGPSPPYLQYDNGVERQPQQEDQGVDSGEQNPFEILLVCAAAVGDAFDDIISVCFCEGVTAREIH